MSIKLRAVRACLLSGVACSLGAAATPVLAQPNATPAVAPVEEVLITGSLIHGAPAVGIPVTALGTEDFQRTGALTISDLLRSVPSVQVVASTAITNAGSAISRGTGVDIHGLNSSTSPRTLMMVDGMRYPPQGHGTSFYDPSIIPQLAVERVDVLADGASATYGSDAVAGVLNVILKRRYEGAVTQFRFGGAIDGDLKYQASQLWGTQWDGGDVTLSYEFYKEDALPATKRIEILSYDYTPWGLDNRTPVNSSVPATVSTGRPNVTTGTTCSNCFSVPKGQNGQFLSWAQLLSNKGVFNEVSPYQFSDTTSAQQRNAATLTFDQTIYEGVELFVDGFYSNRRAQIRYPSTVNPASSASFTTTVPTTNPFYPAGAPAGLNVSYNISAELTPRLSSYELSQRWAGGFNLELPFEWLGRVSYQISQEKGDDNVKNLTNVNAVNAVLGNTVASAAANGSVPGQAAYTKPANIPFFNPFCDAGAFTCNSPATLAYIGGFRFYAHNYQLTEWSANFDGPVFALPGGEVRAAVGGTKTSHDFSFVIRQNFNSQSNALISTTPDYEARQVWAVYGQLNVPVFGEDNAIPGFQRLELEASYRYDHYNDFGGTKNPKFSVNWAPIEGLVLRGTWGTSFRAPAFSDLSPVTVQIHGINQAGGVTTDSLAACQTVGGTPVPGSVAAILNPTCSAALRFPGGLSIRGGAGGSAFLRPGGAAVGPEKAKNLSLGFDFNPTFLPGLDLSLTYFKLNITNLLQGFDENAGAGLNDPGLAFTYILPSDPNFASYVDQLLRNPVSQAPPSIAPSITFIVDGGIRNVGDFKVNGFDFAASYDQEIGNLGSLRAGVTGTYFLHRESTAFPGAATTDTYNFNGQTTDPRFRYRAELGWEYEGFSTTVFMNYRSHYFHNNALPPTTFLAKFPNYSNLVPAFVTVDLSLGYNTGGDAVNDYLDNLDFRFVVNNVADKLPPFMYRVSGNLGNPAAFDISLSPIGRTMTFVITKTW
jgi:iron complex outermembrane receptor protein